MHSRAHSPGAPARRARGSGPACRRPRETAPASSTRTACRPPLQIRGGAAAQHVLAPRRGGEQRRFGERSARELDAEREAGGREAARNRDRRETAERPRDLELRIARRHAFGSGRRRRRRQENIVALEELNQLATELAADPE